MQTEQPSQISGHLDLYTDTSVTGWIRHECSPLPPTVTLMRGSQAIATGKASRRRIDVERALPGCRVFGFTLEVEGSLSWPDRSLRRPRQSLTVMVGDDCGCSAELALGTRSEHSADELRVELYNGIDFEGWIKSPSLERYLRSGAMEATEGRVSASPLWVDVSVASQNSREVVRCLATSRSDLDQVFGPGVALAFEGRLSNRNLMDRSPLAATLWPEGPVASMELTTGIWADSPDQHLGFLDLSAERQSALLIGASSAGILDPTDLRSRPEMSLSDWTISNRPLDIRDQASWFGIIGDAPQTEIEKCLRLPLAVQTVEVIDRLQAQQGGALFADLATLDRMNAPLITGDESIDLVALTELQFAFWYRFHRSLDWYSGGQGLEDLLYYFIRWIAPITQGEYLLPESQRTWLTEPSYEYEPSGLSTRLTDAALRFHTGPMGIAFPLKAPDRAYLVMTALMELHSLGWGNPILSASQRRWFVGEPAEDAEALLWNRSILGQMRWQLGQSPDLSLPVPVASRKPDELIDGRTAKPEGTPVDVQVVGLVGHPSGVGQNADLTLRALNQAGWAPRAVPLNFSRHPVGTELLVGGTLTGGLPTIIHAQPEYVADIYTYGFPKLASGPIIGFFAWEMETLPPAQAWGARRVDEVWVPSEFSAVAFREHCDSVKVVHHAIDVSGVTPTPRQELGVPEDAYLVHFSFDAHSSISRKNPKGAIQAFLGAFGTDDSAYLLLKIRNHRFLQDSAVQGDTEAKDILRLIHSHPRIVLVTREVGRLENLALMATSDCHLSLHRAEGFGYGMAEAMALGVPVVATGYSGNLAYMDSETAWLVDYRLRALQPGEFVFSAPGFRWAEPELDHAIDLLLESREGVVRDERAKRGKVRIESDFSLDVMSKRMGGLLAEHR